METSIFLLKGLFTLYTCASVLVVGYAFLYKRDLGSRPIPNWGVPSHAFWFFGLFLFLYFFAIGGFEQTLYFIPRHWGHYVDPESFRSTRGSFAAMLALIASATIAAWLNKVYKDRIGKCDNL